MCWFKNECITTVYQDDSVGEKQIIDKTWYLLFGNISSKTISLSHGLIIALCFLIYASSTD